MTRLPLSLLTAAAAAVCLSGAALAQEGMSRTISVSGTGEVYAVPDMVTLRFSATSRADSAAAALEANAEKASAVRDRLKKLGVESKDLTTSDLSLSPYYERDERARYDRSTIAGYEARNTLTVRLREVEGAGEVIDAVVAAGANGLDGLNFGFEDRSALLEEARKKAVAEARSVAALLAEEAGVSLGQVMSISETGGRISPQPVAMMRMEAADAATTPIEAGEQAVSASVSITYSLK
jgi:uncharacterized protein YggE